MQTIHAYTGDQNLVDGPHSDLRRARARRSTSSRPRPARPARRSLVLESMKGKLDGTSLRVPVPTGSIVDFTANLKKAASVDADQRGVRRRRRRAARSRASCGTPRIRSCRATSSPIRTACIFDAGLTMSMGKMVKVLGWYDNEWGYSNRLVDTTLYTGSQQDAEDDAKSRSDAEDPDARRPRRRARASGCWSAPTSTCRSTTGTITDDFRIRAALPTIEWLTEPRRASW